MEKKTFIKNFVFYFIILALGGILYSVVRSSIPIAALSVREKGLVGIWCLGSYFIGNVVMFVFHKLRPQKTI